MAKKIKTLGELVIRTARGKRRVRVLTLDERRAIEQDIAQRIALAPKVQRGAREPS